MTQSLKTNSKNKMDSKNTRAQVAEVLIAIQRGQSLSSLLDSLLARVDSSDKSFAHALLLTTLRHWHAQSRLIDSLADKPIDEVEVRTILQLGLTQLLYLQVADHAAIHETVEAVKALGFDRAAGLINAILRKVAKNPNKFRKKADKNHSLPNWLAYQLKQDWVDEYDELTQNLRQPAPMFLRVNHVVESADNYKKALLDSDIDFETVCQTVGLNVANKTLANKTPANKISAQTEALRLSNSLPVSALPKFAEGAVSVQDAHAQLAAPIIHTALLSLMDDNKSRPETLKILDACAAPGGKLAHWLDLLNQDNAKFHVKQINVRALDNEAVRLSRVDDNLERLKLTHLTNIHSQNICADATTWQVDIQGSEGGFDAILLDAPCTATGVIRRHPDISLLRVEDDVAQTVQLQADILDNLWSQLKAGGILLYVTCSILKQENVQQMQSFLSRHQDATVIEFNNDCSFGIAQSIGRQCLPIDEFGGDGFYFALLQKQATN